MAGLCRISKDGRLPKAIAPKSGLDKKIWTPKLTAIYAAAKAAVISLTQSAALALIKDRIRVNAIASGVIDTEMWDRVEALHSRQFGLPLGEKKREVGLAVPYGRMGYPCEVAFAAAFSRIYKRL